MSVPAVVPVGLFFAVVLESPAPLTRPKRSMTKRITLREKCRGGRGGVGGLCAKSGAWATTTTTSSLLYRLARSLSWLHNSVCCRVSFDAILCHLLPSPSDDESLASTSRSVRGALLLCWFQRHASSKHMTQLFHRYCAHYNQVCRAKHASGSTERSLTPNVIAPLRLWSPLATDRWPDRGAARSNAPR